MPVILLVCACCLLVACGRPVAVAVTLPPGAVAASLVPGDVGAKDLPDLDTPFPIAVADGAVVPGRAIAVVLEEELDDDDDGTAAASLTVGGWRLDVRYQAGVGMQVGEGATGVLIPFDGEPARYDLPVPGGTYPVVATHRRNHECPVHDRGLVAWRSARAWRTALPGGGTVTIIDADADDVPGDGDGIAPGDGPVYAPRRTAFGTASGAWILAADGAVLRAVDQAGSLVLSAPWEDDRLAIRVAVVGEAASAVLGDDRPAVCLPPGVYQVAWGLLLRDGVPVAGILPGDLPPVVVAADATATLAIGGPLRLVGGIDDEGSQAVIPAERLHLAGRSGERYVGIHLDDEPDVELRADDRLLATGTAEYG